MSDFAIQAEQSLQSASCLYDQISGLNFKADLPPLDHEITALSEIFGSQLKRLAASGPDNREEVLQEIDESLDGLHQRIESLWSTLTPLACQWARSSVNNWSEDQIAVLSDVSPAQTAASLNRAISKIPKNDATASGLDLELAGQLCLLHSSVYEFGIPAELLMQENLPRLVNYLSRDLDRAVDLDFHSANPKGTSPGFVLAAYFSLFRDTQVSRREFAEQLGQAAALKEASISSRHSMVSTMWPRGFFNLVDKIETIFAQTTTPDEIPLALDGLVVFAHKMYPAGIVDPQLRSYFTKLGPATVGPYLDAIRTSRERMARTVREGPVALFKDELAKKGLDAEQIAEVLSLVCLPNHQVTIEKLREVYDKWQKAMGTQR